MQCLEPIFTFFIYQKSVLNVLTTAGKEIIVINLLIGRASFSSRFHLLNKKNNKKGNKKKTKKWY